MDSLSLRCAAPPERSPVSAADYHLGTDALIDKQQADSAKNNPAQSATAVSTPKAAKQDKADPNKNQVQGLLAFEGPEAPQAKKQDSLVKRTYRVKDHAQDKKAPTTTAVGTGRYAKYPCDVPTLILRAWSSLIPAIIELSYHSHGDRITLAQAIRATRALRPSPSKRDLANFKHSPKAIETLTTDVLIPLGTLPIESSEAPELLGNNSLSDWLSAISPKTESPLSAQSRNEAMMCLEMLCSKAWYERNINGNGFASIHTMLLEALTFMYWECGIPDALCMLWESDFAWDHPLYEQVRKYNYRQLYLMQEQGGVESMLDRIDAGVEALRERRLFFASKFNKQRRHDPRYNRSLSAQIEAIRAKYFNLSLESKGGAND